MLNNPFDYRERQGSEIANLRDTTSPPPHLATSPPHYLAIWPPHHLTTSPSGQAPRV